MSDVVWTPDEATIEHANATRLVRRAGVAGYDELVRRSQDEPEWFWPLCVDDLGIEFSRPWDRVLDDSRGPEWTTWFVGGTAQHRAQLRASLGRRGAPTRVAAVGLGEDGSRSTLTFAELSRDVTRLAEELVALGVGAGDRVAIFLPMSPEVAVASHAIAHIGAVQVPVFSGFAAPAVAQRLEASEAKVVITRRESSRRGRSVPMLAILEEAIRESGSPAQVVLAPFELDGRPGELPPLEVDSEAPYLLTYTSGTTGKPKGVLHVQGGFLVSIAREAAYQADVHEGDVMHFATDMGWIMGPWTVVGVGALGGTIVFAEGAPDWPTPDRLWRIVEQERVTSLGLSPTLARALLPARRSDRRPLVAAHLRHDGRAVEPRAVPVAGRERRRLARADHQLLGRHRGRRLLPLADARRPDQGVLASAGRRSGWRWTSSTTPATRWSGRARSASSCAAGRSPG